MTPAEFELLARTWLPVARLADVRQGVVAGNILGTELVVFAVDGAVTVAAAACPHRGVALWLGRVTDGALECPYHGWLFAPGTGACRHVPSLASGAHATPIRLRTYPVRTAYGLVWSCLEPPYLPFPRLADNLDDGWHTTAGEPYDLRCGLRQLTENFRDRAHFPFVHAGSMGPDLERVVAPYRVMRSGRELSWTLTTDLEPRARTSTASQQVLDYRLLLPGFASIRVSSPGQGCRLIGQFPVPLTADGSRVRQFWIVAIDASASATGLRVSDAAEYERQVFEEDHIIVENQFPAEAPLETDTQVHTAADRFSIAYRAAYRELLDEFVRSRVPATAPVRVSVSEA
ncbi:MAG TPA: aromatic ring-hydroxylating dioxygenase subunit alpha [Rugosimonospora sp.]|nr:aromatic ring-hydroxylating dioxygenase subunit alpha [Rugosimonospora sp.]